MTAREMALRFLRESAEELLAVAAAAREESKRERGCLLPAWLEARLGELRDALDTVSEAERLAGVA